MYLNLLREIKDGDTIKKKRGRGEVSVYFDTVTYIYEKPHYSVRKFKRLLLSAFQQARNNCIIKI